jgi:hypothetical protein
LQLNSVDAIINYQNFNDLVMKFYQETTVYKDNIVVGTYLLNDSKSLMYAYVPPDSKTVKQFKNPIRIDIRGRQFKEVKNTFKYTIPNETQTNPRWEVRGSKGDLYIVERSENGLSCTCAGFKFRGQCKHIKDFE